MDTPFHEAVICVLECNSKAWYKRCKKHYPSYVSVVALNDVEGGFITSRVNCMDDSAFTTLIRKLMENKLFLTTIEYPNGESKSVSISYNAEEKYSDEFRRGVGEFQTTGYRCSGCSNIYEKRHQIRKCSRCFAVGYCSMECQQRDWAQHREECQRACVHCKRVPQKALKCGRCRSAIYCGKICQTLHWTKHKSHCYSNACRDGRK